MDFIIVENFPHTQMLCVCLFFRRYILIRWLLFFFVNNPECLLVDSHKFKTYCPLLCRRNFVVCCVSWIGWILYYCNLIVIAINYIDKEMGLQNSTFCLFFLHNLNMGLEISMQAMQEMQRIFAWKPYTMLFIF